MKKFTSRKFCIKQDMKNYRKNMDKWIAPKHVQLPDFILYGAMKCGTSTLHYILNQHPQIGIPDGEIGFFDIDNILQHPAYSKFDGEQWICQDLNLDPEKFWYWYSSHFKKYSDQKILGEDSTTYLASNIAAKRLSLQEKNIKLIILLRQPTLRAYSHYWHLVRTGRATYDFEKTILNDPWSVIHRSLYLEQLKYLFNYIPKSNIKIILFEDFVSQRYNTLNDICTFLGVDFNLLPSDVLTAHKNKSKIPKFPSLQIWKSRLFPEISKKRVSHLPFNVAKNKNDFNTVVKFIHSFHKKINPSINKALPPINQYTKKYLDNYFKKELDGINYLLQRDVMSLWFN